MSACGSRCTAMASSAAATGTAVQSVSTTCIGGAASSSNESPSGSGAAVSGVLSADEELQRDWEVFGRPELYEVPTEQELRDLGDSRNRGRGERERRKRLKRNRQLLERMRKAEKAVPHYLLERDGDAVGELPTKPMDTECSSAGSDEGGCDEGGFGDAHQVEQPCPPAPLPFLRVEETHQEEQPSPAPLPFPRVEEIVGINVDAMPFVALGYGNVNYDPLTHADGGSADCYYLGPDDHDRLERRERVRRVPRMHTLFRDT